jgi:hypothetical protein
MKQAEFSKTPQGDGFLFQVTPAPKASGGCVGVIFNLLLALLGGLLCLIVSKFLAFVAFIGIAVWAFMKLDLRKKSHRKPSSFFVSADAIETGGQRISKTSIHRIIIRNAYDNTPKTQFTGQPVSTGVVVGQGLRNTLEQISYSLNVEAGGKATQLAGGMDEVTAYGLFTEVSQILGLSENP